MTTGQLIQQARKNAGLSQKQLGEKLGLSASMIGQWENDLRNPKMETLLKISDATDCDIAFLLPDELVGAYFAGATRTYDEIRKNQIKSEDVEELSEGLARIFEAYENLNEYGQQEAVKRVEELTEIPRYRAETAPESTPPPSEGNDTTPPPDAPETPSEGE